jgi:hypothetical protein
MIAIAAVPLVTSSAADALTARGGSSVHETQSAHAYLHCGSVTFMFSPDNPVTYFQLNAIGVSCAVAKHVLVNAGHHDPKIPAGWTYVNSGSQGANNCFIEWKRDEQRVIAYRANGGAGC